MEDVSRHCPFTQFTCDLLANTALNTVIYHLQHESGFNINIVLYSLWLAKMRYGRLTKRQLKLLLAEITVWHQRIISELKYTHALVANQKDPIAVEIKNALQAEIIKAHFIEQHMLYQSSIKKSALRRSLPQQLVDACASLLHYCELKNDLLLDEDQQAFIGLFSAVFDTIESSDIVKQIQLIFEQLKTGRPTQLMWEAF